MFFSKSFPVHDRNKSAVVITGASSGIGSEVVKALAGLGFHVFACLRDPNNADGLLARVANKDEVSLIKMDVSSQGSINGAYDEITEFLNKKSYSLVALVNNAASEQMGPFEILPMQRIREEFDVKFFGTLSVTKAFINLLRKSHGRIVNMSSVGGRMTMTNSSATSATCYAIESFSDAIRMELEKWNISVSIIEPGGVRTPLMLQKHVDQYKKYLPELCSPEEISLYFPDFKNWVEHLVEENKKMENRHPKSIWQKLNCCIKGQVWLMEPAVIAKNIVHAIISEKPKTRYLIGSAAWMILIAKLFLSDRAFDRFFGSKMF
ncbi:MAG: SDR family NAD(P)-dependent oxidoreductase [Deltaproteobacteria bacterium]|nr:SDR family NAD(P)-dependent oxidoreductase [Deltaproteobacteria bacterium]